MIIEEPNIEERIAEHKDEKHPARLLALQTITELLSQIDFSAEVVPANNPERLIKLLVSLKGEQLNTSEMNLVYEIASK